MMLAGIAVADRHVIELARMLRDAGSDDTAARLESAYEHQARLLSIEERDEILVARPDLEGSAGSAWSHKMAETDMLQSARPVSGRAAG